MKKDLLVGSTGFVGGNLQKSHEFFGTCHSKNVQEYYDSRPHFCVYAGVPAAMFLANADPEKDLAIMRVARENIRRIAPENLVLISSIAVYGDSRGKYEEDEPDMEGLPAYGRNRLQLEKWVREDFPDALIVRLPALYGVGLKKNFLFDMHQITPNMLTEAKYQELCQQSQLVREGYAPADRGFYKLTRKADDQALRNFFAHNPFNALSFTDSRSKYQFYPLHRLWNDIQTAFSAHVKMLHLCTPPITAKKVYDYVNPGRNWHNELTKTPLQYDLRSHYSELLGGQGNYLCTEEQELHDILNFLQQWKV